MSDTSDIAAQLAALSDTELVAVLQAATVGRPALAAVHTALTGGDAGTAAAVEPDYVDVEIVVSPDTPEGIVHDPVAGPEASGQVGGVAPVPPVPGASMPAEVGGYSSGGVPTFESVRDKVEQRYGTAQGMGELDRQTPAGRSADEQWEAREKAARERLEQIRKSVRGNDAGAADS